MQPSDTTNLKVHLDRFGLDLNNDAKNNPSYNIVDIVRDRRSQLDKIERIHFKDASSGLKTNKREHEEKEHESGIMLKFEGGTQFNRYKADDIYHYGSMYNNVLKNLGLSTPVKTKVDISTEYAPNSTLNII